MLREWCFARVTGKPPVLLTDLYGRQGADRINGNALQVVHGAAPVMQVGFELKGNDRGDGVKTKGLGDAVDQAFRGVGGLVEQLPSWLKQGTGAFVVPIVVTTASLFVTDQALDEADLQSGELSGVTLREVEWLWFDVHLNRSLLPDVYRETAVQTTLDPIGETLAHYHRRGAIIANVSGLKSAVAVAASFGVNPLT